ncbi:MULTISPECIES: UDP-glucose 4-epimerase GalE [unclassified Cyanobium]|uniref:UDP-glucose 4-epimerase GalE n=1 Tax=unclassified Cyanobium TaxID=2627006 RepID=UPI0020CE32B0|nr:MULTISPECIES: UDP-glucose 4-epimerase GalE [unclassified Cyanobium]MCP9776341.1 UDP-glucose 4-epimerase GalE [Cyanobium sp. Tous-M-B4]MCP9876814.1 UDP-glucose 4-epimerase GalE [Cyanobium sp. A2C-AMD]
MAQLLITGGAGFIGSHSCLVLLEAGHNLVVLDNFDNSSPESLKRVLELAGPSAAGRLQVVEGDIRSAADLERAFAAAPAGQPITAVVHFAGLKAVGESVREPLRYWDVNLCGSRQLLEAMQAHGCRSLVFSSSCTVYGLPEQTPISESAAIQPINPYGHSKAAVEQLLADLAASEAGWRIARLRYFNPVGAHPSGRIGEDPRGIPNNLFPFVSQVAVGRRYCLQVFGGDWPTRDGSGIRDYIHVMDLAEGHRAALDVLLAEPPQLLSLNLGSGQGHSVLEVVRAFELASGRSVPYTVVERRDGDAASTVADPRLATTRLGWRTRRSLEEMCRDGWTWQQANPEGYGS